jgi:lipoprotein-anchoring transpeptidase ErfK/SrfK
LTIVGIAALAAIVIGGFLYLSSAGSETRKTSGKEWMWGAVIGLALMLCSYLILYTINPQITSLSEPKLEQRTLIARTADNYIPGEPGAGQYTTPTPGNISSSLKGIEEYTKGPGTNIVIDKSDKMMYIYRDGQLIGQAPVGIGVNDPDGTQIGGISGDKITPVGDFTLTKDLCYNPNGVYSGRYGSNMGPAFLGISAMDQNGSYRGIGIHGSGDDSLRGTYGCIRLHNADVVALYNIAPSGTPVKIRN